MDMGAIGAYMKFKDQLVAAWKKARAAAFSGAGL